MEDDVRAAREYPAGSTVASLLSGESWTRQMDSLAIVGLDTDGLVREWNEGARRIKGFAADDVLGTSFRRFYRDVDRERRLPERLLAGAARDGHVQDTGWRVRSDGTLFWARVLITAVRDATGSLTGFVKVVSDETADHARSEDRRAFLEAFVHDFAAPLTGMSWAVELLEHDEEERAEQLPRIRATTDHLLAMLDVLRGHIHSSYESAEPLALQPCDVHELVVAVAGFALPGEESRRLRVAGEPGVRALAHPPSLQRVLGNLLDNAAKYSDGPVEVELTSDPPTVRVRDHGRGIDAEDLPTILEPRVRGRLADPGDGGTGLGLASVRDLVRRQGGSVVVDSEVGVGTVVTVTLPAAPAGSAEDDRPGTVHQDA